MKRILLITFTILIILIANSLLVYSGWADYDDKTADEQANKMIEQQEKELKENIGKSNNNYLEELSVKGYELTPKFDRQTIDYEIKGEISDNSIEINAKTEDKNAKISGDGKVNLQTGLNDILVEVTSASGTVRTYHIKVNKKVSNSELLLKKLQVFEKSSSDEIELNPLFDSNVFEYTCETYADSLKIDVEAKTEDAKIKIEGADSLKAGKNVVIITVKSNDGNEENIYKINVIKKATEDTTRTFLNVDTKTALLYVIGIFVILMIIALLKKKNKKKRKKSRH